METKNAIILDFANSLVEITSLVASKAAGLSDNADENNAIIAVMNAYLETVRSNTVLLQNAVDKYKSA